jgi:hypothetical protein
MNVYMRRRPPIRLRYIVATLVTSGALAIGCGEAATEPGEREAVADAAAKVAQVAAAVTGQDAPMADEQLDGKHLGFDTYAYPGDKTMHAWKNAPGAPYRWVGFYLTSPCHKGRTWNGKRKTLTDMGWGLAAVYVGQQTWNRNPKPLTPKRAAQLAKSGSTCNADFISAARGDAEGADATVKMAAEGFPPRSIIFLDIERMEKMPPVMREYYRAWFRRVIRDGKYLPGTYVHAHNAQVVYDDLKAEFVAAGIKEEPRIWVASGRNFEEGKAPQEVGFTFAGVWQGLIDVGRAVANIKLPIDVNVSAWTSPSDPVQPSVAD